MAMTDEINRVGAIFRLYARPAGSDAPWKLERETANIMTNNWFIDLFQAMNGTGLFGALQVDFLGVGTGTVTPARTDSTLVSEWRRYSPVGSTVGLIDPPNVDFTFFSPGSDGAVVIGEFGLWHSYATITPLSGRLTNHAILGTPYNKTTTVDLKIDVTLTRSLT